MITFIITMIIIIALLIVLVVLAQNSKGGGLSSQFGGAGASQVVGVKRTTDLLEKITWGLAISLLVLSVSGTILLKNEQIDTGMTSPNIEKAQEQQILPGLNDGLLQDTTDEESSEEGEELENLLEDSEEN